MNLKCNELLSTIGFNIDLWRYTKVMDLKPGFSFGELALMYNSQRAATVTCTTDIKLWALDRKNFRSIVIYSTQKSRELHEGFLAGAYTRPLFSST